MDYLHDNPQVIDYVRQQMEKTNEKKLAREQERYYADRAYYYIRKSDPPPEMDVLDEMGGVVDGAFDEVAGFFDELADDRKRAA